MWIFLSFTSAFAAGLQNAYFKKKSLQINPILVAWSVLVVSAIFLSPLLLLGIPRLNTVFWIAVGLRLIVDTIQFVIYIKALQLSPLSLTAPVFQLQTVFILFTQFIIDGIVPFPLGIVGVLILVVGVYFLTFDHKSKNLFSPFRAIYKEKGVFLVAIASILVSIVVALQKLAIDNSNPYFYTAFFQIIWAIAFTPLAFVLDKKGFKKLFQFKNSIRLFPAGIFDVLQTLPQYVAYSLTIPDYVNAIGSTSILFSSFLGWIFYKEKFGFTKNFLPILLIVLGVILVSLA